MAAFGPPKWTYISGDGIVIFVTVGAQMPFDRLIKTVDQWARTYHRDDVFAQIGSTDYCPSNIQWTPFLSTDEFRQRYEDATAVIAHAGTGSIITALQLGKPILLMPRRASLRETRNDHQVATAEQFRKFDSVSVAQDEEELIARLEGLENLRGSKTIKPYASRELVNAIRDFFDDSSGHANSDKQISEWKQQLQKSAVNVFGSGLRTNTVEPDLKLLHAKIKQLTLENSFLENALTKAGLLSAKK